jgi:NAD(P)H-hydrate epimerase
LAKAGSGDVLTGLILGLLAQGLSSFRAAELAAFIHGSIADEWVREGKDPLSLQASDLAERLPWILARLRAEEAPV